MPRDLPDCPKCDANQSLEAIRADARGSIWAYCRVCSAKVLIDHHGQPVAIVKL